MKIARLQKAPTPPRLCCIPLPTSDPADRSEIKQTCLEIVQGPREQGRKKTLNPPQQSENNIFQRLRPDGRSPMETESIGCGKALEIVLEEGFVGALGELVGGFDPA